MTYLESYKTAVAKYLVYSTTITAILASIQSVQAHSWMTSPKPRVTDDISGENSDNYRCKSDGFGSAGIATYTRGQSLKIEWLGNNHLAGFVQLAIAPKSQLDTAGVFQRQENIVMISCYRPKSCPRNGFEDEKSRPCTQTMTIPSNLDDGEYSLQWVQYGSGDSRGIPTESLPDYVSCHDFRISGGGRGAGVTCPAFFGGDINGAGDGECSYYTTNQVGNNKIINVPDAKNLKKGPPKYIETCRNGQTNLQSSNNGTSGNTSQSSETEATSTSNPNGSNLKNQLLDITTKLNQMLEEMKKMIPA